MAICGAMDFKQYELRFTSMYLWSFCYFIHFSLIFFLLIFSASGIKDLHPRFHFSEFYEYFLADCCEFTAVILVSPKKKLTIPYFLWNFIYLKNEATERYTMEKVVKESKWKRESSLTSGWESTNVVSKTLMVSWTGLWPLVTRVVTGLWAGIAESRRGDEVANYLSRVQREVAGVSGTVVFVPFGTRYI